MQITIIEPTNEGYPDYDMPTMVFEGHMTLDQAMAFARGYGNSYADVAVTENGEPGCFYASFSNVENSPRDAQGNIDPDCNGFGALALSFTRSETQQINA